MKVIYYPQGIKWNEDNNIAYVIVGIAAKNNEHLDILRQLTRAVIAENTIERIQSVKKPEELLTILQGN
ncbi:PTS sugar transporter subunit IIA [Gilliamella apicola]|uniref:PTS sugar transporter subunit IIA n=1 Tax=Gilliamella apicola TaxID=1196095 RepID=UPI001C64793D